MEKIALLCILITSILAASSRTGLSGDFLRTLLMRIQSDANQLARRMVVLDLDPYELTLSDPALVRHLQRQCSPKAVKVACEISHMTAKVPRGEIAGIGKSTVQQHSTCLSCCKAARRPAPKYSFPRWLMRANGEHLSNIDRNHLAYWRPLCRPNSNQIHLLT